MSGGPLAGWVDVVRYDGPRVGAALAQPAVVTDGVDVVRDIGSVVALRGTGTADADVDAADCAGRDIGAAEISPHPHASLFCNPYLRRSCAYYYAHCMARVGLVAEVEEAPSYHLVCLPGSRAYASLLLRSCRHPRDRRN